MLFPIGSHRRDSAQETLGARHRAGPKATGIPSQKRQKRPANSRDTASGPLSEAGVGERGIRRTTALTQYRVGANVQPPTCFLAGGFSLFILSLYSAFALLAIAPKLEAQSNAKEEDRLYNSALVIKEAMGMKSHIPQKLLDKAECVIV